ncbi:MAG: hypothetical protein RBU37_14855 [Myxococcota bacterium]|jgi:hypothetical protein|nr:hypothetical protein [Myxococcota bacterium]
MNPQHAKPSKLSPLVLLVALGLAACGPQYRHFSPVLDVSPSNRLILNAHANLRASFLLLDALQTSETAARFATARHQFMTALSGVDPDSEVILLAAAKAAYRDKRVQDGLMLLERAQGLGYDSEALFAGHSEGLVDAGEYALARELSFDALDRYPGSTLLNAAADRAIDEDLHLIPKGARRITANDADALKALGGGSTVTLKLVVDGNNVAAIKPDQDLGQSMYRSEIAYYRLCTLLRCSFRVPYNEEVRFLRSDFNTLYGRVDSAKQRGYRAQFSHLTWRDEGDGEYLYATAKEWVPAFTGFPIEASSSWSPLLDPGEHSQLATPASEWLSTLAAAAGERGWNDHSKRVAFVEGLSTNDLMRQLSDLVATDFLTNNWDRFAGSPELYGANCHIEAGGLVAIDNGAAFPPWHTDRVKRRLNYVHRFSKKYVSALRRLEYDPTLRRLFPNANKDELKRFDIFWERRTDLLEYVDAVIAKHGEEAVLAFP